MSDSEGRVAASGKDLNVCLVGCAPDTGNLGVSTLCYSTLTAIKREAPDASVTVFDNGRGHRQGTVWDGQRELAYALCGGRHTRRFYDSGSLWNIRMCCRLGGLRNPGAVALLRADALLDVTGGDSFSDLYGPTQFQAAVYPKLMALETETPLILLPQTYGPFRAEGAKRLATSIVAEVRMAWARDARSFESLKGLLGKKFDPARHRCGVDVAFGLSARPPRKPLSDPVAEWLDPDDGEPVIGLNVNGIVYNFPDHAAKQYHLQDGYRLIVAGIVERFLERTSARLVLVPHVRSPTRKRSAEGDQSACRAVYERFRAAAGDRIAVLEDELDPSEMKHVIAQMDWFCGTRMHSTIAALSSGVPASAVAYSDKTLGVFETCGQGEHVADPRQLDATAVCERVWQSWCEREGARKELERRMPAIRETCREQIRAIIAACIDDPGAGR